MFELKIKVSSALDMTRLGKVLCSVTYPNLVIAMTGDLGAGKTTFTKGIGEAFEIKRVINSPTFTIMKVYDTNKLNNIEKLYHLDVYRLTNSESDFELEEYFYQNGLTVVEWADIISDLLPDNIWKVSISNMSSTERVFTICVDNEIDYNNILREVRGNAYEIIS